METLAITGGIVLTPRGLRKADILVEGGTIQQITRGARGETRVDASGCLVLPGFVNTHTHLGMTLLRGVADILPYREWLERVWELEKNLKPRDVYLAARLACLEMIKSGTTQVADFYIHPRETTKALREAGLRATLGYAIMEGGDMEAKIRERQRFLRELKRDSRLSNNGRLKGAYAPHSPLTCEPETLWKIKELARKDRLPVHIHLQETRWEIEEIKKRHGKTPIQLLESLDFLDRDTLAVHCTHLTEGDISILEKRCVGVSHNPTSNLKLQAGIAPIPRLLRGGVRVGLGTDSAVSNNTLNLQQEMRLTALLHSLQPVQALKMATCWGAKLLGTNTGTLEPGKKADIILVELEKPHLNPKLDMISNLVFASQPSDVKTVLVEGEILMEDRRVETLDEEEAMGAMINSIYDSLDLEEHDYSC